MNPALPNAIHFGREVCGDLFQAERREWWLSTGLGAYATGSYSHPTACARSVLLINTITPITWVVCWSATALTIRARLGLGCSGHYALAEFRVHGDVHAWLVTCALEA